MKQKKTTDERVRLLQNRIRRLNRKINTLEFIAGEALYLADAYSGGESETTKELSQKFERVT